MKSIIDRLAAEVQRLSAQVRAHRGSDQMSADALEELARRVDRLEAQLEGLQDAVYRQDVLHDRRIADLESPPPHDEPT
jgi:outer membrane murein-binding lipoprotein Lpp